MRVVDAGRAEALLDYSSLIDRLQGAFREGCEAPLRHRHEIGPAGSMLIKPAWRRNGPLVVKVANVFPGNAAAGIPAVQASVLLFDGATGAPLAAIDGRTLTNRRTAAASALAARHLARTEASAHLVIGTGQLAPELARAHAAVRPISETLIWGRNPVRAVAVVETLAAEGMAATAAGDLAGSRRQGGRRFLRDSRHEPSGAGRVAQAGIPSRPRRRARHARSRRRGGGGLAAFFSRRRRGGGFRRALPNARRASPNGGTEG